MVAWLEYDLKIFVDQLKYGIIFPNSKTAPQWRAYENEIFAPLFAGQVDVKTATENYAKKMNEILATE